MIFYLGSYALCLFFCDVFGAPYRVQIKQGRWQMIGRRGGNLCVCWEQARGLFAEDDIALDSVGELRPLSGFRCYADLRLP